MKRLMIVAVLLALPWTFAGCKSEIRPMQPLERVELWIPDDGGKAIPLGKPVQIEPERPAEVAATATSMPAEVHPVDVSTLKTASTSTAPATQTAAAEATTVGATEPATTLPANLPPGHKIVKIIDHNQTSRFVYDASYDNIWQQSMLLIHKMGFAINRADYRLGILTSKALPSAQFLEFWKPQQTDLSSAMENTVNSQRRYIRLTISKVPLAGKERFHEISVQVLVEREANPSEVLGGPLFVEGSGFGRSSVTLRSDYADPNTPPIPKRATQDVVNEALRHWVLLGDDPVLEKKILDELFKRI